MTESAIDGTYVGSHLTHATGSGEYGLELYENTPVEAGGALDTPWRVAILGSPDTVMASTLVDDLAPPNQIEDTSWIEPGIAAWSWITGGSRPDLGSQIGAQATSISKRALLIWRPETAGSTS